MSDVVKPQEWAAQLRLFLMQRDQIDAVVDRRELTALQEWQCRVSGGALLKFLRFLSRPEFRGEHPELEEVASSGKRLVCITDTVGALAAHDILRMFRPQAVWMYQDLWEEWLADGPVPDPELKSHIEYRSLWIAADDDSPLGESIQAGEVWIHCESYRLDAATGRDLKHLWIWADEELRLIRPDGGAAETS